MTNRFSYRGDQPLFSVFERRQHLKDLLLCLGILKCLIHALVICFCVKRKMVRCPPNSVPRCGQKYTIYGVVDLHSDSVENIPSGLRYLCSSRHDMVGGLVGLSDGPRFLQISGELRAARDNGLA